MPSLSKGKLERIAVNAVIAETNKPISLLKANIPVGDKGISFDGDIEVFEDDTETKGSLIGKVPVQVKGTQVNEFSTKNRNFSLEMEHFKNYYNSNGVVLFVVEVKIDGAVQIFYKQLLPKELREIIRVFGEEKKQKKRIVTLRPLKETNIDSVCLKFVQESRKQPPVLIEHNPFNEEDFTTFELTSLTFDPYHPDTSNIFDHDFTLYGKKESLSVPLDIGRVQSYSTTFSDAVIVDSLEKVFNIRLKKEHNITQILIEDSLELTFSNDLTDITFKLVKLNSIEIQLQVLPLLLNILNGKQIVFKERKLVLQFENNEQNKRYINKIEKLYITFQKLKDIFADLNISANTEFKEEKDDVTELINLIMSFIELLTENKTTKLQIKEPELAKFTSFTLGGLQLILFYSPDAKNKMINAFSKKIIGLDTYLVIEDNKFPISPYVQLNETALAEGVNIDLEIIKSSFDQFNAFSNEITSDFTNQFCLMCINAYDLSGKKELLNLAEYIYNTYPIGNKDEEMIAINRLQINIRKNKALSEQEVQKLVSIKQVFNSNIEVQFCSSVLLGSEQEAKLYFSQLNKERQSFYKSLPIYFLFQNLKNRNLI